MKELQIRIEINASKTKVWDALWDPESFKKWATIIDPGTYLVGELKEGGLIQFISGNGYGVTSLVAKMVLHEYLLLKHQADTQAEGTKSRADEWTGGEESYYLDEKEGKTVLTVKFDVPEEMEEYFLENYPKALEKVKELTEVMS